MEDGVAFAGQQRVQLKTGFGGELLEAFALQLMGKEDGALPCREFSERIFQFGKQNFPRVDRFRTSVGRGQNVFEMQRLGIVGQWDRIGEMGGLASAKEIGDPIARHAIQPCAGMLDGLHQAISKDELAEHVLQYIFYFGGGHARANEAPKTMLFALKDGGELLVGSFVRSQSKVGSRLTAGCWLLLCLGHGWLHLRLRRFRRLDIVGDP